MNIPFAKYHGAGNDFVIFNGIDLRAFVLTEKQIIKICDRRFGIGADGILILKNHVDYDFRMTYFNADGSRGSFCGNGGRCIVAFIHQLGLIKEKTCFIADDGIHHARVIQKDWIELKMCDVTDIQPVLDGHYLHTGTEHYVEIVSELTEVNVDKRGKELRFNSTFKPNGTNVNYVKIANDQLDIRTYEKGVEAETLACGTGAIAAVIVAIQKENKIGSSQYKVNARGGQLEVRVHYNGVQFTDIWLCGGAAFVFKGTYEFPFP